MNRWVVRACVGSLVLFPAAVLAQAESAPTPAPIGGTQAPVEEKVRCKRYTETGSLAKTRKECHTEKEWRQLADNGRRGAQALVGSSINTANTLGQ
jgi:hypothetical protein